MKLYDSKEIIKTGEEGTFEFPTLTRRGGNEVSSLWRKIYLPRLSSFSSVCLFARAHVKS